MRRFLLFSLPLVIGFSACQRDFLDPKDLHITASPGFLFPLAHVNLDLDDVLPVDTTGPLTVTDQPYYVIAYTLDSLAQISAADLLQIPAQAPVALSEP